MMMTVCRTGAAHDARREQWQGEARRAARQGIPSAKSQTITSGETRNGREELFGREASGSKGLFMTQVLDLTRINSNPKMHGL